jgi:hypothetical protein
MNKAPQPIQIDAQLLALLSPDVVRVLSWGQRFELPGKMVWHAWG